MLLYVIYNVKKLIWYEDDKNYNELAALDLDKFGPVNFQETSIFIFYNMYKQRSNGPPVHLWLTPDVEKYIKIEFIEETNDYYVSEPDKVI